MAGAAGTLAQSPYSTFADILSRYHSQYTEAGPSSAQLDTPIPYDVVLDQDNGMIEALMGSLEGYLQAHRANSSAPMPSEEYESMLLEHRTWALIRAVYDNRLPRADPAFVAPSASEQIRESPYTPPEELVQTIVNEDSELALWATLVGHLQSRPLFTSPPPIESRTGYLPSTMRRAKAARLNNGAAVTTSLDPDFTLRDPHGQSLAGEDQTYQAPLLETLWDLVRHGELDQAVKVCEEGGEPWRAASLMGGRRWNMSGLTNDSLTGSAMEGNRTRALWKKSCRAIAKNPTLSSSERSLYAALISDLQSLLPACQSWEDHLWAHITHLTEKRLDRRCSELGGFWQAEDQLRGRDDEEAVDVAHGGLDQVFASIASVQSGDVANASQNPYYVAQKMVILGRAESLLNTFADRISGLEESVAPELIGPLMRFFAHLVLVLRSLNQPVPESAANYILEAYLSILKREGKDSLVAMYAACLREGNGEESYARFLRGMDPNATREVKQEALLRAKQYNLNVTIIAKLTVSEILKSEFEHIPALALGQPDMTTFSTGLSERDVRLIRSIEWLTMVPETYDEALLRSNDVARYFLALGQATAAEALLRTLPAEITTDAGDDDDSQLLEHDSYRRLLGVFACHEAVDEILSQKPKATATKVDQHNWRKRLLSAIEKTHDQTRALLTSGWLRFHISSRTTYSSQRRKELARIRQIFVPDLVLRLHNRLVDNRELFPALLQRALDMTKLVAAEDYHVYEEFLGSDDKPYRLVAYLDRVREASMAALQSGSPDPFKAVAVVQVQ
ncbi:Nucleoporin nup84 [Apiotrichum porosum]|uniref:Nuclear pore complex protein n=1 Tax=Apiotrichum porosum TaxID=105984 RepID=A0A427XQ22_9TREE|nr:Nucleoporin nup84 [Apiotrichum porosum]RSH80942.1 Nucleoporin nup84 [Apiotrichum porosum]